MEHVKSLLPPGKKWKLVWHDEFDGDTLDKSKWSYRLHLLQRRHETFTDRGAFLDGKGNLLLALQEKSRLRREPTGKFTALSQPRKLQNSFLISMALRLTDGKLSFPTQLKHLEPIRQKSNCTRKSSGKSMLSSLRLTNNRSS